MSSQRLVGHGSDIVHRLAKGEVFRQQLFERGEIVPHPTLCDQLKPDVAAHQAGVAIARTQLIDRLQGKIQETQALVFVLRLLEEPVEVHSPKKIIGAAFGPCGRSGQVAWRPRIGVLVVVPPVHE